VDKSTPTVVRWELAAKDGGTLVTVTHSGLAQEEVARKDYAGGWPGVMEQLKTLWKAKEILWLQQSSLLITMQCTSKFLSPRLRSAYFKL